MIIFLYGADTFRSRKKLRELKDKFLREVDPEGSSLVTIEGETTTLAKINGAVASASLFARKRMVVVENIFANKSKIVQDEICDYFKKQKEQENIIVFWDENSGEKMGKNRLFNFLSKQKSSEKNKFIQNFMPMTNTEIISWIKAEVKIRGGKISQKGAYELAGLSGGDLWQLNNEIDKLINYKKGANPELIKNGTIAEISEDDVRLHVRGKVDENIFALTDAISAKNKGLALQLFDNEIEAGVADSYLMFMIIRQFKILLQVRSSLDQGYSTKKITTELKLHPFVVQKSLSQVRNFTIEALKNIISSLVRIDKEMKVGKTDFQTGINLLLLKL